MIRDEEITAVGGFATGVGLGWVNQSRGWHQRTRDAQKQANSAQTTANNALAMIQQLAQSGDLQRLGNDRVSDFLLGLAYPGQQPACAPSAFAGTAATLQRPAFLEAMAEGTFGWPGITNTYDANGNLVNPNAPASGQNFSLGLALGFAEIRALLLGFAQQIDPDAKMLQQYYRFAQGFALTARAMFGIGGSTPSGLSQAQWQAVWQRVLAVTVPGASGLAVGLLDQSFTDGIIVSNTTSETVALTLNIPANSIVRAGDTLNIDAALTATGVNSTNTDRVRAYLDSTSGPLLWDSTAVNPTAGDSAILRGQAKAQAVGSTTGKLAVGGLIELSGTVKGPANAVVNFDNTIAHAIVFTVTQSAASTGNTMLSRYGQILLQSVPPVVASPPATIAS